MSPLPPSLMFLSLSFSSLSPLSIHGRVHKSQSPAQPADSLFSPSSPLPHFLPFSLRFWEFHHSSIPASWGTSWNKNNKFILLPFHSSPALCIKMSCVIGWNNDIQIFVLCWPLCKGERSSACISASANELSVDHPVMRQNFCWKALKSCHNLLLFLSSLFLSPAW